MRVLLTSTNSPNLCRAARPRNSYILTSDMLRDLSHEHGTWIKSNATAAQVLSFQFCLLKFQEFVAKVHQHFMKFFCFCTQVIQWGFSSPDIETIPWALARFVNCKFINCTLSSNVCRKFLGKQVEYILRGLTSWWRGVVGKLVCYQRQAFSIMYALFSTGYEFTIFYFSVFIFLIDK